MADNDEVLKRLDAFERSMMAEFRALGERIARVEGRVEEQSKILQVALAGRQSRKTAA
ncbi:MAG: hypothetical protein WCK65_06335 [Rhodospirillaceae bacterium]